MISDSRGVANEVGFLITKDAYRIRSYPENAFKFILDIGANIGIFSVFARMRHPNAKIIAVEPCIETCRYLRQNIEMLDISLEEKAIGDGSTLYLDKGKRGKHEILGHKFMSTSEYENTYRVESITLKQLNDKYSVRRPYALKLNCEGGEFAVSQDLSSFSVLRKAEFIGVMIHYKTDRNAHYSSGWSTLEYYDSFFEEVLSDTHRIDRHHNDAKRGSSIYSIYKKGGIQDGVE